MARCVICEQRKGKRHCALKSAMVCSQCCGLVQTEGNCPGDCPFLLESKNFASEKQDERENQLGERFKRDFDAENEEVMQTFNAVATPLNDLFVAAAEEDEYLVDKDLVEALDDLIKNTKEGVGQVVSPEDVKLNRAGSLVPQMKEALESFDAEPPVADYLIVPCLEILRGLVSLSTKEEEPKAYVDQLLKQKEEEGAEEEEAVAPAGEPVLVDIDAAQAELHLEGPEAPEQPSVADLFEEAPETPTTADLFEEAPEMPTAADLLEEAPDESDEKE